ncbi:MAG: hypothetical protein RTV31_14410 [Candidatus Thorarchaeota archaeon]
MSTIQGSLRADSVINNPETIRSLDQRSIIIYARRRNQIGIAINIFLDEGWDVKQCWTEIDGNNLVLLINTKLDQF